MTPIEPGSAQPSTPVGDLWVAYIEATRDLARQVPVFGVVRRELFELFAFGQRDPRWRALAGRIKSRIGSTPTGDRPWIRGSQPVDVLLQIDKDRPAWRDAIEEVRDCLEGRGISTGLVAGTNAPGLAWISRTRLRHSSVFASCFPELCDAVPWISPADRQEALYTFETAEARVRAANDYLALVRPLAVVLACDPLPGPAATSLAARNLGIPTVALQHGSTGPRDLPINADRLAVWGSYAQERLRFAHQDASGIVVTGSPRHDRMLRAAREMDRRTARSTLGLDERSRLVTIFTSGHAAKVAGAKAVDEALDWQRRIIELAGDAWDVIVKPHPNESPDLLKHLGARLAPADLRDNVPLFVAADCVAGVYSTTLEEACLLERPALQLLSPEWPDLAPVWRLGGARRAKSPQEAIELLRGLELPGASETWIAGQSAFRDAAFANREGAGASVADLVESLIAGREGRPKVGLDRG